jgi:hypothetical protein
MELMPRDLDIQESVGELGTADTELLRRWHFPSDTTGRACQQRLRTLTDEGLLKRVRLVAIDQMHSGSLPALYFLTEKGADLVERETGRRPRRVARSDPKPFTLRHRLETVRVRVAIDEAARVAGLPAPAWIMEQDTRGNRTAGKGHSPSEFLVLNNRYQRDGQTVSFRPDSAWHLQLPHNGGELASLLGYAEIDRSTEGHLQWHRKLGGVEAFLEDPKAWCGHWPGVVSPVIRVFVFCKSARRIAELIEVTKNSAAAGAIRFTTYPVDPATVLVKDVWQNCRGEFQRIVRQRPDSHMDVADKKSS